MTVWLVVVVAGAAALAWAAWKLSRGKVLMSGDLRLHPIAPDVWIYRGYFSNSAVLQLPGGVVVVDTQITPRTGERLRREIARVTDAPIRYVVNTHYHGDHVGGNAAFADAEIVATEDTARFVRERDLVDRCVLCGCGHLYIEKDFNRAAGFAIVVVAVIASGIAWAFNVYVSVAILAAAALLDLGVWLVSRERAVCYKCEACYRGAEPNPAHGRYELGVAGRFANDYDEQRRRHQD